MADFNEKAAKKTRLKKSAKARKTRAIAKKIISSKAAKTAVEDKKRQEAHKPPAAKTKKRR